MLDNIRVVLIRPFHPGNIGSSARSMKTMGLHRLYLVNPLCFPDAQANKMAASAEDVLDQAVVVDNLFDAIKDCTLVAAATARQREYELPTVSPEQCAAQLLDAANNEQVALLFGPERFGISNEDLELARLRVNIPANPDYSSLNLAAAVQILSYEIYKQHQKSGADCNEISQEAAVPSVEDLQRFYSHLESTYSSIGFINQKHPGEIMQRLRHLYARAQLRQSDLNILRGILTSINKIKK